jgi:hypothetical protein
MSLVVPYGVTITPQSDAGNRKGGETQIRGTRSDVLGNWQKISVFLPTLPGLSKGE